MSAEQFCYFAGLWGRGAAVFVDEREDGERLNKVRKFFFDGDFLLDKSTEARQALADAINNSEVRTIFEAIWAYWPLINRILKMRYRAAADTSPNVWWKWAPKGTLADLFLFLQHDSRVTVSPRPLPRQLQPSPESMLMIFTGVGACC